MTDRKMPGWIRTLVKVVLTERPVIVLGDKERIAMNRNAPRARVVVLPNCVDLVEAREFTPASSSDKDLRILFLGRIVEDKGLRAIYCGLKQSRANGVRTRFIMAGAGPDEEIYVRQFRELLGSDFDFAGRVAGSVKTSLLKECNVFLLPSMHEGLPMALLESMVFGLVPITTNVGSIPDVVEDGVNGILVNRNSPEEISAALATLSSDREYLETLQRNARSRIFEYCNPERYVSQLNEIYSYDEHNPTPRHN